jgi:hypothetical protein
MYHFRYAALAPSIEGVAITIAAPPAKAMLFAFDLLELAGVAHPC